MSEEQKQYVYCKQQWETELHTTHYCNINDKCNAMLDTGTLQVEKYKDKEGANNL